MIKRPVSNLTCHASADTTIRRKRCFHAAHRQHACTHAASTHAVRTLQESIKHTCCIAYCTNSVCTPRASSELTVYGVCMPYTWHMPVLRTLHLQHTLPYACCPFSTCTHSCMHWHNTCLKAPSLLHRHYMHTQRMHTHSSNTQAAHMLHSNWA
jgi:hypothetical protein